MAVQPIDGNELVRSLKNRRLHILMENENDGAAVFDDIVDWIKYTPTLTPPNEPRMINADKLAKRIAGHSNYHGDSILAAIYCAAEGKENDVPIRPIENPPNEWVSVDERLPETAGEYFVVYHPCHWDNVSAKICVGIDSFRGKTAWAKKKYQRVTHWMPLPAPPDCYPPEGEDDT